MGDDYNNYPHEQASFISIHVPRVGDDTLENISFKVKPISIHVPRVGDDTIAFPRAVLSTIFQSTSPAWGTTARSNFADSVVEQFQSTSPAWGTTMSLDGDGYDQFISIHVPRVGDDAACIVGNHYHYKFQSTSPAWGTTASEAACRSCWYDFNPRPPRGGRLMFAHHIA